MSVNDAMGIVDYFSDDNNYEEDDFDAKRVIENPNDIGLLESPASALNVSKSVKHETPWVFDSDERAFVIEPQPQLTQQLHRVVGKSPNEIARDKARLIEARNCTDGDGFSCKKCGKHFDKVWRLTSHIRLVHENILKHWCITCKAGFRSPYDLRRHQNTHTDQMLVCDSCEVTFTSKQGICKHFNNNNDCLIGKPSVTKVKKVVRASTSQDEYNVESFFDFDHM